MDRVWKKILILTTVLSCQSIEAVFVGSTAPDFAAGIVLFNPTTKRTFIRHWFKYMSDTVLHREEDLTSADDPAPSSISSNANHDAYAYLPLPIACSHSKFRFAFAHLDNTFLEKNTNMANRLHKITYRNNASFVTLCF